MPQTFRFSRLAGYACLMLALLLASASICWAGNKPSPESCEALGHIIVTCIICETGEFVGVVSVDAEYDADHQSCLKATSRAFDMCLSTYGMDRNASGMTWEYSLGTTNFSGCLPESCKH